MTEEQAGREATWEDVEKAVMGDDLLGAMKLAASPSVTEEQRAQLCELAKHVLSMDSYKSHYADTMWGAPLPEEKLFKAQHYVRRFVPVRRYILESGAKTVLDLGCLDGWCLLNLAAAGLSGAGVDLNAEALAVGKERATKYGFALDFFQGAIEDALSIEGLARRKFDAVILSEVLEHVLNPAVCIAVAAKHLAPRGVLYVSTPASPVPHRGKVEDAVLHLRVLGEEDLLAACRSAGLHVAVAQEIVEEEDDGQRYEHRFLAVRRARVAIYCNHVTGGWDPSDLAGLNGSEEAVVQVAERWAKDGHDVTVYQNGWRHLGSELRDKAGADAAGRLNGVLYRDRAEALAAGFDLLVGFKSLEQTDADARVKLWWTIESPGAGGGALFFPPQNVAKYDAVLCASEWHRRQVLGACPWLPPEKTFAHWLGVDPAEIMSVSSVAKVPGRCVYASSLDRGLHELLDAWPEIKRQAPHAELRVLYGWDYWKRYEDAAPGPVRQGMAQARRAIEKKLQQPGVTFVGRPATREAYLREMAEAEVWPYPCNGGELCCKVALEAQALGCVPVALPTMALSETVLYGQAVPGLSFADQVAAALLNIKDNQEALRHALSLRKIPAWDDLADFVWKIVADKVSDAAAGAAKPQELPQPAPALPAIPAAATSLPLPERFPVPSRKRIARRNLDIVLAAPGMPFAGDTDRKASLGGSETMCLQLGRELARRGHRVTTFSNLPQGAPPGAKFDGVTYVPIGDLHRFLGGVVTDAYVAQRDPMLMNLQHRARIAVLWMHDLALARYQQRLWCSLWNVDYLTSVSHWHGRQLAQVYSVEAPTIAPMRNAVETDVCRRAAQRALKAAGGKRDRHAVVWAARPERGLDLLLDRIYPRLLERDPKLVLYVAGYDNTVDEMRDFYAYCQGRVAQLGERARWLGHLKKEDLYALYGTARAYLYPTRGFEEVSCISVQEAAACGLPFVGCEIGALPETAGLCPGAAVLVPHGGEADEGFISRFVDAAASVIGDDVLNRRMSDAGRDGAEVAYDWKGAGDAWEDFLLGAMEARSENAGRRLLHHWRIGDVYGAARVAEELIPEESAPRVPLYRELAVKAAMEPDMAGLAPSGFPQTVLQAMGQLQQRPPRTVLAPGQPDLAVAIAALLSGAKPAAEAPADLVVGFETLDVAADPAAQIDELEKATTLGGTVVAVAAGPAVAQHRVIEGAKRRGRWVFDSHDLRELLGQKRDLLMCQLGGGAVSAWDETPLTWTLVCWTASGDPTGRIDFARRAEIQSPGLSVSVCMLSHNSEAMLHRCLRSLARFADEIVVADDRSTDSTLAILEQYGAEWFEGLQPLAVGFDEARNQTLEHARGDIVIWLDSDEELLDGEKLPKYLRWNMFGGYAVRQHHFSAEPPNIFKPDLPVRIFRRVGLDGKPTGIRFWGVVHEHPEKAINESVGSVVALSDVNIAHDGYLTEAVRRRRFDRNIGLMFRDQAKYPARRLGKFLMIRDWLHLGRNAMESAGGRLTPEAAEYLEAALAMYRKEFIGQVHMLGIDGLAYYNESLQRLGRGHDVQVTLKVAAPEGPRDYQYTGRVLDADDLQKLLTVSAEQMTQVWRGKYL